MSGFRTCLLAFFLGIWLTHGMPAQPSSPTEDPATVPGRPRLDLCGTWQFRMDPRNEGLAGRWYAKEVPYPDKIQVPGNWQAQGFGPPRGWLRHDYQGIAWYRRQVQVPATMAGKRIWLHLGGTANTADIFVNGTKVGSIDGFIGPYEYDVTEACCLGTENTIACRVDSASPAPIGMFNFVGRWGGLYRGVHLETRSDPAIDDLFVIPDVMNKTARVRVALRRRVATGPWQGQLFVQVAPSGGGVVRQGRSVITFKGGQQDSEPATIDIPIPDLHTWSPEDPFLYAVEVVLTADEKPLDRVRDRVGMRQFEVGPGGVLLLNGRPYFVRGLGDDTFEVLTGTQFPDKGIYLERLKKIKRYGFNGIRFLAHTPIKEYFEAADEAGVLLMCEGVIYHKPKAMVPLLKRQVARVARAYRNHPSWYIFSSGNELFECQGSNPERAWMDYIGDAHAAFKRLDPTRFFVASDGADVFPTDIITQRAMFDTDSGSSLEHPFNGLIDEVAYFKRALNHTEMSRVADRTTGSKYPGMIRALKPSGYWRLEETSPGKALDSSGHGRHGVYDPTMKADAFHQPGIWAPERPGGAIRTSTWAKGVSLKGMAPAAFASGNEPFSISLWVKPSAFRPGDWGNPFSYGAASTGRGLLIAEDGQGGSGRIVLGRYWGNFLTSEAALASGQWNHIGISYDGSVLKLFLNGKSDKSTNIRLDTVPIDGRIGNVVTERYRDDRYQKAPHIWHEFNNTYVGCLPDLTVDAKFTGIYRDDHYLSYHRRQIANLGLTQKYPEVYRRSVDLFYLYLKHIFESARQSPTLDGYAYWLMTDTPAGPEGDANFLGIFNLLYEPAKFPDPAPIVEFNRETVLLVDANIDQRVLAAGEAKKVNLSISHYGSEPIIQGKLTWEVNASGQVLQRGLLEKIEARPGEVKPIGSILLGPYHLEIGQKIRLQVQLNSEACRQENHWDFWVFPPLPPGLRGQAIVNLTGVKKLDARYGIGPSIENKNPIPREPRVILTTRLTRQVIEHLARGRTALLLSERGGLKRPRGFTFWAPWIRNTGTFIEPHPALDRFPHDGFCAFQFYRLWGDSLEVLPITEKGSLEREKLKPLVWGLSGDYDPALKSEWSEPRNRWKLFRHGLVCEGRIGPGRVLVSCLRLLEGLERGLPEAGFMLDSLVGYALSGGITLSSPAMTVEEAGNIFTDK